MKQTQGKQSMYEIDGVKDAKAIDFVSFLAKAYVHEDTSYTRLDGSKGLSISTFVNIPKPIREALSLQNKDQVVIAIRKATPIDIEEYTKK